MEGKRKHSRKRDAILDCMRNTTCHPTAEWVYQQLKPIYPDLSLGTVYRNLAMFKESGTIQSIGVVGGIYSPEIAEEVLAKGQADYVLMGRSHSNNLSAREAIREGGPQQ